MTRADSALCGLCCATRTRRRRPASEVARTNICARVVPARILPTAAAHAAWRICWLTTTARPVALMPPDECVSRYRCRARGIAALKRSAGQYWEAKRSLGHMMAPMKSLFLSNSKSGCSPRTACSCASRGSRAAAWSAARRASSAGLRAEGRAAGARKNRNAHVCDACCTQGTQEDEPDGFALAVSFCAGRWSAGCLTGSGGTSAGAAASVEEMNEWSDMTRRIRGGRAKELHRLSAPVDSGRSGRRSKWSGGTRGHGSPRGVVVRAHRRELRKGVLRAVLARQELFYSEERSADGVLRGVQIRRDGDARNLHGIASFHVARFHDGRGIVLLIVGCVALDGDRVAFHET